MSILQSIIQIFTEQTPEPEPEPRLCDVINIEPFSDEEANIPFYNHDTNDKYLYGPGGIENDPGYIAALADGWWESDYRKKS